MLNTTDPEFSSCFERTVFDLTPCGMLLIVGIPYLIIKRKSYDSYIPMSGLFISKIVSIFYLCSYAAVIVILTAVLISVFALLESGTVRRFRI